MELSASPVARGASPQITTCAEDPAGPTPMIVTDLGIGIPVAYTAEGVALAIPAEAAAEGGAGTIFAPPEDIPAADEGSWDVADGVSGTMVSVSFLVLRTDSLEAAVASRRRAGVACRAHLLCPGQHHHARPSVVGRGLGAPRSFRVADGRAAYRLGKKQAGSSRTRASGHLVLVLRRLERSARQVHGDVAAPSARPCSRGSSRQRKRRTSRRFDSSSASGSTSSGGG